MSSAQPTTCCIISSSTLQLLPRQPPLANARMLYCVHVRLSLPHAHMPLPTHLRQSSLEVCKLLSDLGVVCTHLLQLLLHQPLTTLLQQQQGGGTSTELFLIHYRINHQIDQQNNHHDHSATAAAGTDKQHTPQQFQPPSASTANHGCKYHCRYDHMPCAQLSYLAAHQCMPWHVHAHTNSKYCRHKDTTKLPSDSPSNSACHAWGLAPGLNHKPSGAATKPHPDSRKTLAPPTPHNKAP